MKPIRVLHVVTYMGRGGLETMLMNYYRHIDRKKIQFDFLVHRYFEADYDVEIESMGGRIYHVSRLIPWSRSYREKLQVFFKSHPEYEIVHVHQDCLSSVALKVAKECGVPVRIAHSHNSNQDKNFKYLIKRYYMRKIPNYATHLFACGKDAGDWMFGKNSYQILHNAIDTKIYQYDYQKRKESRTKLGIGEELLIGHVGRFRLQKNHVFLIDIFAEIVKQQPDSKLLLVGDGDEKEKIQVKIEQLQLQKNVLLLGARSDVNELMQAMDVFVFPSLYEGLPLTMIEAQAAGLPCVISDSIPRECVITKGLVSYKGLNEGAKEWAAHILTRAKEKRVTHDEEMKQSGYDVNEEVKRLEAFYLEQ